MHEPMWLPVTLEDQIENMEFDIYDPNTDKMEQHSFQDYNGKYLVLFFYPADFTFVCPTELKDLNKVKAEFDALDAEILVVSTDTVFTHKNWVQTERLLEGFGIKMVSDRKGDLSAYFNVLNAQSGNSERGTFIIDPDGIVKAIEVVTEPIGRSSAELLRKVKALHHVRNNPGLACPASWNTGAKTIKPGLDISGKVAAELE